MTDKALYRERITSSKTEALFVGLAVLFAALFAWRWASSGPGALAITLLAGCVVFLFYALNFRTLVITLSPDHLTLTFGIFTWRVPLDNVEDARPDALPAMMRLGGAGIHFMSIRGRYRASYNFLEYPRVVIALKRKAGLVCDISFSTRQPEEILRLIQKAVSARAR